MKMLLALSVLLGFSFPVSAYQADTLRVHAAKIKVLDFDESVAFYRDMLGLQVLERSPERIVLDGVTMPIILEQAHDAVRESYPRKSQTILVFQTSDIRATLTHLREQGADIVSEEEPYGHNRETGAPLGLAARFRDPSGIVHSLVEHQVNAKAFEGLRVYNIGFYLPDMEVARALYSDALGFVVLSEQYLPTAIPLGHPDYSFAFMLHARPGLEPATLRYPGDAQSMVVFEVTDLGDILELLERHGVERLHDSPQTRSEERFVAFRDAFGNVSEVIERR